MVLVTYPGILPEISNSRYALGLLNSQKGTCIVKIYQICVGYTDSYTDSQFKGHIFVQVLKTILPAYDKVCNRSDRAHHIFILSQAVEMC